MSVIGNPLIIGNAGGGGSIVVIDTPDSHGGTIREIIAAELIPNGDSLSYGSEEET